MNKKLILMPTAGMDDAAWLQYRKRGIGASEVSAVMGLSPWKSSLELFYEKIDRGLPYTVENMAMFMGTESEEFVAKLWTYWEGTEESIIKNYRAGRIVRRCRRVNAFIHNPDYPWLFVSLDRLINKTNDKPEGPLEIKTTNKYSAEKWENNIDPGHVVQVQTQTTVGEFIHGELATMVDGRNFECLPFAHSNEMSESIVRVTRAFWDRVEEARKIVTRLYEAEQNFNNREVEKLQAELQQIEPEPDGSEAYESFLKKKYTIADPGERPGTDFQLGIALQHKAVGEEIKQLEETQRLYKQQLINVFRDDFDKMDFGKNGFVSWKANKNAVRVFLNKIKQ